MKGGMWGLGEVCYRKWGEGGKGGGREGDNCTYTSIWPHLTIYYLLQGVQPAS